MAINQNISNIIDGTAPKETYITQIQWYLNKFPWSYYRLPDPKIPPVPIKGTVKITPITMEKIKQGLNLIKKLGAILNLQEIVDPAIEHFLQGNYYYAEYTLNNALSHIKDFAKPKSKYTRSTEPAPSFDDRLQEISQTKYPAYFPSSKFSKKNRGGGAKPCYPWKANPDGTPKRDENGNIIVADYEDFRACSSPKYNSFLMWGPGVKAGLIGIGQTDPRRARAAAKYPSLFSPKAIKERVKHDIKASSIAPVELESDKYISKKEPHSKSKHSHIFHIPSPGFTPYIEPPKGEGLDTIYKNPLNADQEVAETGQVKFLDEWDRDEYWRLRELFNQYKQEEFAKSNLTKEWIETYHKFYDTHRATGKTKTKTRIAKTNDISIILKIATIFENLVLIPSKV